MSCFGVFPVIPIIVIVVLLNGVNLEFRTK
jgi:hypothetical protein